MVYDVNINDDNHSIRVSNSILMLHDKVKAFGDYKAIFPTLYINMVLATTVDTYPQQSTGLPRNLTKGMLFVVTLINYHLIDKPSSFFKMRMKPNCMWAMEVFGDLSPMTMTWHKLLMNALLALKLSKFNKLTKMTVVQIMGSVEDERVLSTLSFIRTKLRLKLTNYLDLTMCMVCQNY